MHSTSRVCLGNDGPQVFPDASGSFSNTSSYSNTSDYRGFNTSSLNGYDTCKTTLFVGFALTGVTLTDPSLPVLARPRAGDLRDAAGWTCVVPVAGRTEETGRSVIHGTRGTGTGTAAPVPVLALPTGSRALSPVVVLPRLVGRRVRRPTKTA